LVPIHIEHQFGASFRLSASDVKGLDALMASLQKDSSKAVVGFYRSRTRNDSLSEDSESAVLAALENSYASFQSDFHYFVVFTPISKSKMMASASFRTDEGWGPWQQVTLVLNPLSAKPPDDSCPIQAAEALSKPQSAPSASENEEPLTPPDGTSRVATLAAEAHFPPNEDWPRVETGSIPAPAGQCGAPIWWYAAAGLLLAAIGLGTYMRTRPATPRVIVQEFASRAQSPDTGSPPVPVDSTLRSGLSASRDGGVWKVTWDRAATDAFAPAKAVLSIRDGGNERRIDLGPTDRDRGAILYVPQSNNLLFSLNLATRGGQMAEEHVRVMEGRIVEAPEESLATIVAPEMEQASRQSMATPERPSPFPSHRTAKGQEPQMAGARSTTASRSAPHRYAPRKPFTLPTALAGNTKSRTPSPSLPPPPTIMRSGPDGSERPPFRETLCCLATATYEPITPSGFQRVIHKIPVLRRLGPSGAGKGFIPPRPTHEIQFAVPPNASLALMERKRMDLKASVDASGRVTGVKLLSPRDENLVKLATYPASGWRFEPAELNDRPVPGEVILHFNFDTSAMAQTMIDESRSR
jgi:hypothetical protein